MEENEILSNQSTEITNEQRSVFTQEAHTINPFLYALMSFFGIIWKGVRWLLDFVFSMIVSIGLFFKMVGIGIYQYALKFVGFFKRKAHQFKYNDKNGRLSFGIFGFSALANKQYVFGVLYILFEIGYILLFALFGARSIGMLGSLGTRLPYEDPDADFSQLVMGDNSIMILIYGLLWILSIFIFIYVWNRSIQNGYYNYRAKNLLKFEHLYNKNLEFDRKLDAEVQAAFEQGIPLKEVKKNKQAEIEEYLNQIEDNKEKDYTRYLINESFKHSYRYLKQIERENRKLSRIQKNHDFILKRREQNYDKLVARQNENLNGLNVADRELRIQKDEIKREIYQNRTKSYLNNFVLKLKSKSHKIEEIEKRFLPFVDQQLTNNNAKYGKVNYYYKHVAELESEIIFYDNFSKFVSLYHEGLEKYQEKNKENAQSAIDLLEQMNSKLQKTSEKFDDIRARKLTLENELKQVKLDYKDEVSKIKNDALPNKEELLLEAKAKMVDRTTVIMRKLNDLPSDKNVKALEKEEIKESKRAYARDKKYLKTNYTDKELGFELVVNELVVEYKFDYHLAVSYAKQMFVKEKGQERRIRNANEVAEKLADCKERKAEYVESHPDKYAVKFQTFVEAVKSLFNERFNITILFFPIIGIVLFSIVPLIFSIFIAFTNYSKGHEPPTQLFTWIGFENFKTIFAPAADSQFAVLPKALSKTIGWTLLWAIVATFSNYILGIIVALMINKDGIKFKKLWRTVFVMTIAIPQFISLLSIGTLLKDSGAIGQWYFKNFGSRLGFGSDGSASAVMLAKFVIIMVNIWVGIPYTILSTTGILLNIPKDLYESAKVDGAGAVTQFAKITMPYILFVTGPYLITQFIGNINNFNVIFFLTGGGPALSGDGLLGLGQTDLLITFIYKIVTSNANPQYGIASTIGIVVFVICSFISIVMYSKSGSIKEEDQFQ